MPSVGGLNAKLHKPFAGPANVWSADSPQCLIHAREGGSPKSLSVNEAAAAEFVRERGEPGVDLFRLYPHVTAEEKAPRTQDAGLRMDGAYLDRVVVGIVQS